MCAMIPDEQLCLVRLHPKRGGSDVISFEEQDWRGVVFEKYIFFNPRNPVEISDDILKFSIHITVDPAQLPARRFCQLISVNNHGGDPFILPEGHLPPLSEKRAKSCDIHGDLNTGLRPSRVLCQFLSAPFAEGKKPSFSIDGKKFVFNSIGIAMNNNYNPISRRFGADQPGNGKNHVEIKFIQVSEDERPRRFIYLNIHLDAATGKRTEYYNEKRVMQRLSKGIRLFYHQLGVLPPSKEERRVDAMIRQARVKKIEDIFNINLDNFEAHNYQIQNPNYARGLAKYRKAVTEYDAAVAAGIDISTGTGAGGAVHAAGALLRRRDASDWRYRTELCSFFESGHCLKGDTCDYAHGEKELRRRK